MKKQHLLSALIFGLAMLMVINVAYAQPAAPTALVVLGVSRTEHSLAWKDNATDEDQYRIERSTNGGSWQEIETIGPQKGYPRYRITGANPGDRYLYRIRTYRVSDKKFSNYSNEYASPQWIERPNVRVFFNTSDCPSATTKSNCVPNITNPAGENEMAARIADVIEGAHTEYNTFGFRDPWIPSGADREPVNLVWADGGGESGNDGVRLGPDILAPYDHTTNTGDASSIIVPVHEYLHSIQYAYKRPKQDPAGAWMGEGQARAVQDLICVPIGLDPCVNVDDDTSGTANYYGEVNGYLGNPNRPVNEIGYAAALFWTYLCQEYGSSATEPHIGMDFIRRFLDEGDTNDQRDGIQVMDATLAAVGSDDFEDAFKKFVVANYAKDLTGANVPGYYRYADEQQPPTPSFRSVRLDLDLALTASDQIGPFLGDVERWGARYCKIRPDAAVSSIQVDFSVDSAYQAYFTLLAVKNGDIIREFNHTGKTFSRTLVNNAYDEVMVIVAGLDHNVNFRYAVNATTPVLRILDPLATRPVDVGSHTSPEKFLVKLEVLSATAAPVTGISFGDFNFTVGTQQVPAQKIVTEAYVQGQYWFVLQAPGQSADGIYDLSVDWSTQSDTVSNAVNYTARSDTDNVLVIDRSGSMGNPLPPATPKIADAKKAAKLYVDSWRTGDKIGVVSFAGSANPDLTLRDWTDTSRTAAHTAIDDLSAFGGTSIGAGLAEGLDEFDARGAAAHTWALILLSDGMNTTGDDIDDFLKEYQIRQNGGQQVPEVHTVAIGADANRPDLQKLAIRTGGSYHFASEPSGGSGAAILSLVTPTIFWKNLSEIFRVVSERIVRQSQLLSVRGKTTKSTIDVHPFPVDAGASELVAVVSYKIGDPVINLIDPNGNPQTPFAEVIGSGHAVYRIASPLAGFWQVELGVNPSCQEICPSEYLAEASVKSELTMELYLGLSEADRIEGTSMPILAALTESGPVPNAAVAAEVTLPSGEKQSLPLLDDGRHQDGAADDGIYGNTLWAAAQPGSYQLVVQASGSTEAGGPFVRRLIESFHLRQDTNADNDCLPDGYEDRVGLDTSRDDGAEDPDEDGLDNCTELEEGTDPFDPDTDDGGESDGSELDGGRDVHQPGDDLLSAPRIYAYPGVDRVFVYFNVPPNVVAYDIFRAEDSNPGSSAPPPLDDFVLLNASYSATDPFHYIDEDVTNGSRYWYYLVSLGSGGNSSGPSDPVAATPRTDPYAPHGTVVINAGGPCTNSIDVVLTLFASDEWDPESLYIDHRGFDPRAEFSQVADMMISNSSDFAGATWEAYAEQRSWSLDPDPSGFATVYVRYRDHAGNVSDTYHGSTFIDQEPPVITCPDYASAQCHALTGPEYTGNATAFDGFDPNPTISFSDDVTPGDCPNDLLIERTWTAADTCGNTSSCVQTIDVLDDIPPVIYFNAPATITPPDAPISFTATATDNCDDHPSVEITDFDCFKFTKKGKRIDKTKSCVVRITDDTVTILDSGGVDTQITWTGRAEDSCRNFTEETFKTLVVNPAK